MKNDRYMAKAIALLREQNAAPERCLALSDDDLEGLTLSLYNLCQEVAAQQQVNMELDLDDTHMMELFMAAHNRDITFNELIEETLERVILEDDYGKFVEFKAKRLYEQRGESMDWDMLTDDQKDFWLKVVRREDRTFDIAEN